MPFNMNAGYGRMIAESLSARRPYLGKVFFVIANTHADWEEVTEMFPPGPEGKTRVFTDLQSALDQTTTGGDDVIFIAPGYTETLSAAGDIDINSNQLSIIGLGEGTQRPTFTFDTAAAADWNVDGAGVLIENIRFDLTGVDALTGPIDVNAAGCKFKNCEFITASSTNQCTVGILTDANADDLIIEGCYFHGSEDAGTTSAIRLVGGDNIQILDNTIIGNFKITGGAIEATTTAPAFLIIKGNRLENRTSASTRAINLVEATRADITDNRMLVMSRTSPVSIAESSTASIGGLVVVAGNYYQSGTTIAAATLL